MKRLLSITILCLLIVSYTQAQKRGKSKDRIKVLHIAFITEKLELTPAESEKFWPLYNEFDRERTQLRKEYRAKRKAGADTDSEAEELILSNFESQEKLIALKRTYFEKYKAVLPIKKLTRLTAAEREFKQVIVEEMKRRRAQKEGKGGER